MNAYKDKTFLPSESDLAAGLLTEDHVKAPISEQKAPDYKIKHTK